MAKPVYWRSDIVEIETGGAAAPELQRVAAAADDIAGYGVAGGKRQCISAAGRVQLDRCSAGAIDHAGIKNADAGRKGKVDADRTRDGAGVGYAAIEGRDMVDADADIAAVIVPLLVIPPPSLGPNTVMSSTSIPFELVAVIEPVFVIPPRNVSLGPTSPTKMPSSAPVIVPLLAIPPEKVVVAEN